MLRIYTSIGTGTFFEMYLYYMEEGLDIDDIDQSSELGKYELQTLFCS